MKLLFCTKNMHKFKEAKEILESLNLDIDLLSLLDFNDDSDVDETGSSFSENSYLKAKFYFDKYHISVFSDDSGLCVRTLNYAPGIYSARFSGEGDKENNNKLLSLMEGKLDRYAFFSCDVCLIIYGRVYHFEGKCEGSIAKSLTGENGFGYDPLFLVEKDGKMVSFASLSEEEKNSISHRHNVLVKMSSFIKENYCI